MKKRSRITIKGIVQGVGFRPFLYRSAHQFQLTGFVKNTSKGVILEVEGEKQALEDFNAYIIKNPPPLSLIEHHETREIPLEGSERFHIVPSEDTGQNDLLVSPDIAICANCRDEMFDPQDRRHNYPFINCTDCGPRFSIINSLPYDRPKTTMEKFPMCPQCGKEYGDPYDRRYHAQPVSCYRCGPVLTGHGKEGEETANPLDKAIEHIQANRIVAVKGLAGYHLACRALSQEAVVRLRELKGRETKPFALMATLEMIKQYAHVSPKEEALLQSPASPILLLKCKNNDGIAPSLAPGLANMGFMTPYTPLHFLILEKIGEPLVMTSANITDEPIIYKDEIQSLSGLSDYILSHDREINIFADDSVAQVVNDKLYMVRRSRGFVPLPLKIPVQTPHTFLALGPMMKTTFTFLYKGKALVGQYIGDTDSPATLEAEKKAVDHFRNLFSLEPTHVVMDAHPGYPNRELASQYPNAQVIEIQHHQAHVGALMAEHGMLKPMIGISMDGTGYGTDGNIWGGEVFVGDYKKLERFGHLKYLFLPSGDKSAKEPWRFALSVLHELYGPEGKTLEFAREMGIKGEQVLETIKKRVAGIPTSSCGRVFDGVGVLMGLGKLNSFEGELPMKLQALAESAPKGSKTYPYGLENEKKLQILNLMPMIRGIIEDRGDRAEIARAFHTTLAKGLVKMATKARNEYNIETVGLTGGVFQNTLLLEMTVDLLKQEDFSVLIHSQVPPNDGGISLGQAFLAAGQLLNKEN